jgi:hypothetical protein
LGPPCFDNGWPITFDQLDNGHWGAEWELDRIETTGFRDPAVQVLDESDGDVVYTVRIAGESFTPLVRRASSYKVIAYDPDGNYHKEWFNMRARKRA